MLFVVLAGIAAGAIPPAHARASGGAAARALADSLVALGSGFEEGWNWLLVAELSATLRRSPEAKTLRAAQRATAERERAVLGTTIASDALDLRKRWKDDALRLRIAAGTADGLGLRLRATDPVRADSAYRVALAGYRRLGERRREAWVLGGIGVAAHNLGDYAGADTLHRHALAAREALGDARMIGNSLSDIGNNAFMLRRFDDARSFLERARRVRERTGQPVQLAATLQQLGVTWLDLCEPDSAIARIDEALAIHVARGDSLRTLGPLIELGRAWVEAGRPDIAMPVLDRAWNLTSEPGLERARIEFERGRGALATGRYATSTTHLASSAAMFRELGDAPRLASVLVTLGAANVYAGEPERAVAALVEAESLAVDQQDFSLQARALNNLAAAWRRLDSRPRAEALGRAALAAAVAAGDSAAVHDASATLAGIAFDQGDLIAADSWLKRALASADSCAVPQSIGDRINLAAVEIRRGQLGPAEERLLAARDHAVEHGFPDLAATALINLADIAERRRDYPRAVGLGRQALALTDTVRGLQRVEQTAIRVFARNVDAYDAFVHLLCRIDPILPDSGYAAEAFLWAERSRARSLMDRVIERSAPGSRLEPIAITEVQRRLGPGQAMLEYSVGDSSTSLWVIRADRWRRHTLPSFSQLRAPIEALRQLLMDPDAAATPDARRRAEQLYRWIIAPSEAELKGVRHLVIVPDGTLAHIPFEALMRPTDRSGARGRYLIEAFSVSYLPSASMLARPDGRRCSDGVVAFGAPTFGLEDTTRGEADPLVAYRSVALTPLPHTTREIEVLASLVGSSLVSFTGSRATREALLGLRELSEARIIHLATHGQSDELDPDRCRLWLAPDQAGEQASQLGLDDITQLQLCAAQVTLAACESGLGRLERGEGTVGLARGFLAAGARSVMASLWNVSDLATSVLMRRFYRGVLARGESRDLALALAKRQMIRQPGITPFYWAAFQLIGDSDLLAPPRP